MKFSCGTRLLIVFAFALLAFTSCSHAVKTTGREPSSTETILAVLHCQHTLVFDLDSKTSNAAEPSQNESFDISIDDIKKAQNNFERGQTPTLLGRDFLMMEPRFGGALAKMARYHWEIGYRFKWMEHGGRPFVEISLNTTKTGYRENFGLKMSLPIESGKSAMLSWQEKKRRYTPEYSLECEIR